MCQHCNGLRELIPVWSLKEISTLFYLFTYLLYLLTYCRREAASLFVVLIVKRHRLDFVNNFGIDNWKKKLVKQQYLLHMSPQCGELRPTSGSDRSSSLGHTANFNWFRVLAALLHGTVVAGVSQTVALNRGRHLYSAGRPSRWASAHILVKHTL